MLVGQNCTVFTTCINDATCTLLFGTTYSQCQCNSNFYYSVASASCGNYSHSELNNFFYLNNWKNNFYSFKKFN